MRCAICCDGPPRRTRFAERPRWTPAEADRLPYLRLLISGSSRPWQRAGPRTVPGLTDPRRQAGVAGLVCAVTSAGRRADLRGDRQPRRSPMRGSCAAATAGRVRRLAIRDLYTPLSPQCCGSADRTGASRRTTCRLSGARRPRVLPMSAQLFLAGARAGPPQRSRRRGSRTGCTARAVAASRRATTAAAPSCDRAAATSSLDGAFGPAGHGARPTRRRRTDRGRGERPGRRRRARRARRG
jgi:hypothetical protein